MSGSYDYRSVSPERHEPQRHRVFVTGAAGRIGSYFAQHAPSPYTLTLMDRPDVDRLDELVDYASPDRLIRAELSDLEALKQHFAGHDTLVHLAADPSPDATWDSLKPNNIVGAYNIFVAAKAAGIRRVVFASSIHAVSGYPEDRQVHPDDPVNPGDLYGVSKCFGEAMGRFMSQQHGLSVICIRIGAFQPLSTAKNPHKIDILNAFVSKRDLHQLICRCIDAEDSLRFAIFHGLSDNHFNRMDITSARELVGYQPQDDFTAENPKLRDLHLGEKVKPHSEQRNSSSGIRKDV